MKSIKLGGLLVGGAFLGAAMLAAPHTAHAYAPYGNCYPTTVQIINNGNQLFIGCRSAFSSNGVTVQNIALNLSSTTATAFNGYVSLATSALLAGRPLTVWPSANGTTWTSGQGPSIVNQYFMDLGIF